MNNAVNTIIKENSAEGTLIVLKGYPVENYVGKNAELSNVIENKIGYLYQLSSREYPIISFDEFVCLYELAKLQYKRIVIIENPNYMNLFPVNVSIEDKILESLIAHFDAEINGDTEIVDIGEYTQIYNNFVMTDEGMACCYNISNSMLKSEKITRIHVREKAPLELTFAEKCDSEEYLNICNEIDYYHLIKKLERTSNNYIVEWDSFTAGREMIYNYLCNLNGIFDGRLGAFSKKCVSIEPNNHYPEVFEYMGKYWGYKSFRSIKIYDLLELENERKVVVSISQEKIICDLIEQVAHCRAGEPYRDVFVTAPTGAGKSLMFQLPAMYIAEKYGLVTLVITPLIGLMNDQVQALEAKGYHGARTINSDISPVIKQEILDDLSNGKCSILYLSPESLLSRSDVDALIGSRRIGMIVIDEAHIVTTWGKQFRPDYWYLGDHVQKIRRAQARKSDNPMAFIIATFTATAIYKGNEDMYHETLNSLHMLDPITYLGYLKRDNLSIEIEEVEVKKNKTEYELDKFNALISIINASIIRNQKVLVYFPTVALINRFDEYCYVKNVSEFVAKYHGQMPAEEKEENFQDFLQGKKLVMIATKAFGMGIDIPDITNVLHFSPTGNVCDYMQEIGRAARDKDIKGHAIYQHMNNDFKHINRLYGLSAIKSYQLIEVIKKVLEIYTNHRYRDLGAKTQKKRNEMLVDADCFSYIFDGPMSDENNLINKVKTAMLLIQKDYENRGFAPFYIRPIPLFAYGFFSMTDYTRRMINGRYRGAVELIDSKLHVCKVNLKKIWENGYAEKMSFPRFKFMLYSKNEDLDFNRKYQVSTAMSIETHFEEKAFDIFKTLYSSIKEMTKISITNNKFLSMEDMVDIIKEKAKLSKYKTECVLNVVLAAMEAYKKDFSKKTQVNMYNVRSDQSGKISYLFKTPSRTFFSWLEQGYNYIINNTHENFLYIVNDGNGKNSKEILTLLGVLEALDVLCFKSLGGSNSQIYIYVNETKTMTMVRERPYTYKNRLLELIEYRHRESVRMLSFLFQNNLSSEQVWDHLENYFLGILPKEVKYETVNTIESLDHLSAEFQIGDNLAEDYVDWKEANILFDNDVIGSLDMKEVPLADYYNARLSIGDFIIEIELAWVKEKILITSGEENDIVRKAASESGWMCIPMASITEELLKSLF